MTATFESQIQPITPAGADLVAMAERLSGVFAERAAANDLSGDFVHENAEDLRTTGLYGAAVPTEFGGVGVSSIHDILLASSRLARGDASTTIGLNMHWNTSIRLVRRYERAVAKGNRELAEAAMRSLKAIAQGEMVIASCATEAGTDLTEPATTAVPDEGGWEVSGTKIFCTGSPAATHLAISASYTDEAGTERIGYAMVPAGAPGVRMNGDWDALGMRTSGSQSITLERVFVPEGGLTGGHALGCWSPRLMENYLVSGMFHSTPALGIAEAANAMAVKMASTSRKGRAKKLIAERPVIQMLAAENAFDLTAMRGVFARAGRMLDEHFTRYEGGAPPDAVRELFKEMQSSKSVLTSAAIRVVDRAMTMSGGAGFSTRHPLSRLYRDVRAGPFMHPMAANTAGEVVGRIVLGLDLEAA